MFKLSELKRRIHRWAFELHLVRRIHNIARYWASGEIRKQDSFPSPVRAVVLSPHPDDESIGCGGTIGLIKEAGGSVDVIYMTSGELGRGEEYSHMSKEEFMGTRMREAAHACGILGIDRYFFLRGHDGDLKRQPHLAEEVAKLLDKGRYDVVFCPWPYDSHSDHEATYTLFRKAMTLCVFPVENVWLYEVWSPLHANRIVNVDPTMDLKFRAMQAYASQLVSNDLPSKVAALAKYRSIHIPEATHAEAFLVLDGPDLALLP